MSLRSNGLFARSTILAGGLTLGTLSAASSATSEPEPHQFLRTVAGFSANQIQLLERGAPLVQMLETDRREVAVVGAIRIKGPAARLFERYRDISGLRRSPMVLQVGTFSTPPRVEDMAGLSLEDSDLETIRACKPGDCGVRLADTEMARFQRDVDWRAADWRQQTGSLWRRLLTQYASGYLMTGALAAYHNKEEPLSVASEFGVLFDESGHFAKMAPAFFSHLRAFPKAPLPGAETILYWSKDNFGIRPVVNLMHLTLYPKGVEGTSLQGLIAAKQIYAAHYFDASLALTLAFDDGASGFYMLCVNRARTRSLTGFMRAPVRGIVQRRSREALEELLRNTKAGIEKT